jgi:hypothetical protein
VHKYCLTLKAGLCHHPRRFGIHLIGFIRFRLRSIDSRIGRSINHDVWLRLADYPINRAAIGKINISPI